MTLDVYLNVAVAGVLTGLVYGLMALGLSVIFGVVRVVNFAHGEMMSIAMYIAVVLFSSFHLDPLVMLVPIVVVETVPWVVMVCWENAVTPPATCLLGVSASGIRSSKLVSMPL